MRRIQRARSAITCGGYASRRNDEEEEEEERDRETEREKERPTEKGSGIEREME